MIDAYPLGRPKYFANKVIRQLIKTCAAQNIGHLGYAIVSTVVMTEDAAGYRRAVTFYDSQLMMILGIPKQHQLAAARLKAIKFGWLSYQHGTKGSPGEYFVTIPDAANISDDSPSDEGDESSPDESQTKVKRITNEIQTQSERKPNESQTKVQPSYPVPSPEPIPSPFPQQAGELGDVSKLTPEQIETMEGFLASVSTRPTMLAGESPEFKAWYEIYPVKGGRGKAWKSYQVAVAVAFRDAIDENRFMTVEDVHAMLLAAVQRYAESPVGLAKPPPGSTREYRPEAQGWLDAKAWTDPPEKLIRGGNLVQGKTTPTVNSGSTGSLNDLIIKTRRRVEETAT